MAARSTAKESAGADRAETILEIMAHLSSARVKLKQLSDHGSLIYLQAARNEIKRAYEKAERLEQEQNRNR